MAQVKLLGFWYSPFTHRVEWALKMKGVEYEYIEEDRHNKSSLLLESNPIHKKTPVLIHNGKPICESMFIVEYIDETFKGPSILPKDPYDRALAHFWAKFLEDKSTVAIDILLHLGEEQEKAKEQVYEMLKVLDNELKDKNFFVAENFGFADIAANLMGFWLGIFLEVSGVTDLVTSEKVPNFCAWRDEYVNCSQVKDYLPPRKDELLVYFQLARARIEAAASAKK
ncbi:putative glutathione S-transferase [Capsicum baccatum]|uniref:Probable glutathione S-transferase n=1 Tax=Capsicum baccatum TaxID=33114 RepID=A0A2G2VX97_CAPBA|nr:putative glutathione S-transferase [Capsicum baccatum]